MAVNLSWWLVTVVAVAVNSATAKVIESNWEVEYKFWWPDCKEGIVMAINGQFPGPTINAVAGDTVIIHVINKLSTEGVVIHWHGIRQRGTPWADGATGVTQCAINPGETFTYNFTTDKAGTHFYHGHYGMQRSAGLYGMLIVKSPQEKLRYDGEFSLLLSDWWHQSIHAQELALSSSPMRWIGEPQSLLINGRGHFNCSLAAYFSKGDNDKRQCTFKERDECAPETLRVKPNSVYRLRIASTTALASLNLAVEGHKLEVVEADGNYVAPFTVDDIDIYSGETYSVLLKTHSSPSQKHWISVGVRGRKPNTTQALTLLNYINTPDTDRPINPPPVTPRWDDYDRSKSFSKKIFAAKEYPPPPEKSDDRLILLNTQNLIGNYTKWAINNVSLSVPSTPYLGSIRYGLKSAYDLNSPEKSFARSYDVTKPPANPNTTKGNGIYSFPLGIVVDVILQNANALKGRISEIHPWHIHGHDFWVLGYGDRKFRPGVDEETYNLKNPPLRNTVVLYPFGWTALRFVTDNPGVWFFHCHIEPHLHMGMGVVFAEGVNRIAKMDIPDEALGCGLTGKWLMNRRRH